MRFDFSVVESPRYESRITREKQLTMRLIYW